MEDDDEKVIADNKSQSNVSSVIMYKIPTSSLGKLREKFNQREDGLTLIDFLNVMVQTMELRTTSELLQIVPDLVDFFKSVDINGDGKMEWSEFVMFVIESVVTQDPVILEKIVNVDHSVLNCAPTRHGVRVSKLIPEFNKLFIGLGPQVLVYDTEHFSPTWLTDGICIKLQQKSDDAPVGATSSGSDNKPMIRQVKDETAEKALQCLDFVYLGAREMLLVLRSDMLMEFHRFMARTKVTPDLIQQNGFWQFEHPYNKIALREMTYGRGSTTAAKVSWKLFAIGESRSIIDLWDVVVSSTGVVSLEEHSEIDIHKDYVRDILVINNELLHYNFFVSCAMDAKVQLFDLATLKHRATRTGFGGGVQCLAYDNRSLLFAGGFDYNIMAWDLDAEIDKPIFQLWGHRSPIVKIVAMGNAERCFSLDQSGKIRLWDSSKANPNDKEARQIDLHSYTDDTIRSFDIFKNVSASFNTTHSCIIAAQGRKQHVYRVVDMTPKESPPIAKGVLFSYNLLQMITVHSHDCLFFGAIKGDEEKKMDRGMLNLTMDLGNEVTSCCLDDRERKLLVGEASGNISVYNILSGVRLKRTAFNIPFGIRDMIYSPDKTVIALAGPGELYIFDELPNEDSVSTRLRYTQAHDVDVVSMAYSYELGLIATADCTDCLKIWDYEFLLLDTIIEGCTGTKAGQLSFIGTYPLLLVTDSMNNFVIIPVGPAKTMFGAGTTWKVKNTVLVEPLTTIANLEILKSQEKQQEEAAAVAAKAAAAATAVAALMEETMQEGGDLIEAAAGEAEEEKKDNSENNEEHVTKSSRPASPTTLATMDVPSDEEEEDEEDDPKKPLNKRKMKKYLKMSRDAKSMFVHVQMADHIIAQQVEEYGVVSEISLGKHERLLQLLGPVSSLPDQEEEKEEVYSDSEDEDEEDEEKALLRTKNCTNIGFPKDGIRISVFCGMDDGFIAAVDITAALREIGVGTLLPHEYAANKKGYDPRRMVSKKLKDSEVAFATWKPELIAEKLETKEGHLSLVWPGHNAAVTTLYAINDNKNCDIMSAGLDSAVFSWTLKGTLKGILTRGREWDKLFRPSWKTPVDMDSREEKRNFDAEILVDALGLNRFMLGNKGGTPSSSRARSRGGGSKGAKETSQEGLVGVTATVHEISLDESDVKKSNLKASVGMGDGSKMIKSGSTMDVTFTDSFGDFGEFQDALAGSRSEASLLEAEPDRSRVIGQLAGRITYHQSARDAAQASLAEKQKSLMEESLAAEEKKQRRKKGKKKSVFDVDNEETAESSAEAKWLDDLMGGSSGKHVEVGNIHGQGKVTKVEGPRKRKIKTKYDMELLEIDKQDPHNWEIHSGNRQRMLYHKMYIELDKAGITKDPMAVFENKLNNLCGGDFRAYAESLHRMRQGGDSQQHEEEGSMTDWPQLGGMLDSSSQSLKPEKGQQQQQEGSDFSVSIKPQVADAIIGMSESAAMMIDEDRGIEHGNERVHPNDLISKGGSKPLNENKKTAVTADTKPHAVDFSWEKSLRTPLYADPIDRTPSKKSQELKKTLPDPALSPKRDNSLKSPLTSPVRLTEAQLLALEHRNERMRVSKKFEETLKETDKLSRISNKVVKKQQRQRNRMMAEFERLRGMSPVEKAKMAILSSKSDKKKISNGLPVNRAISTRHSMAMLIQNKSTSLDSVMEATRKMKKAESNWVRKMKMTLDGLERDQHSTAQSKTSSQQRGEDSKKASTESNKHGSSSAKGGDGSTTREDHNILRKTTFGPYKIRDINAFLRTFQAQPPELIPEDEAASSIAHSYENSVESQSSAEKKEVDDASQDLSLNTDDYSFGTLQEGEEEDSVEEGEEEKEEEEEDAEEILAKNEAARLEEEKRKAEQRERDLEAKHAHQVITVPTRLLPLIKTRFMNVNKHFQAELEKVLRKRTEDGTLERNVLINLTDALNSCFPFMPMQERVLCLRYFVLKTPRTVEHVEAVEKGLTKEQLTKLKAMFKFFDKDSSGGIDKYEIVEVLSKLAENKRKEVDTDRVNDDENKGVELQDAEELIASVNGHDAEELDFDHFAKMFKSLV